MLHFTAALILLICAVLPYGKPCPPGKETDDPQGRCCVFPFVYRGVSYDRCTWINNNKLWCSLDAVYAGQWANCGKCPPGKNTDDPQGRCCVFPFSYGSYFYYSCTKTNHNKFWCSLDYRYAGQWANCADQACKDRDEAACQYWSMLIKKRSDALQNHWMK
ncbi:hypothetical protein ACROYT_G004615 [Oculina patagonica]